MSTFEPQHSEPSREQDLLDEIAWLKAEIHGLRNEVAQYRDSKWFRLRQSVLPSGSFPQRLYHAIRGGAGLKSLRSHSTDYETWLRRFDSLTENDRVSISKQLERMNLRPLFSIVMTVHEPSEKFLLGAIESVRRQLYPNWELCIVDNGSTQSYVRPLLEQCARDDSRITIRVRDSSADMALAANEAIEMATGSYLGFLRQDDLLAEHALNVVASYLETNRLAKYIYSDEDKIDSKDNRSDPQFKPDWDPYLELSYDYASNFSVYEIELVREARGLRAGFEGAQDWDLVLRCTEALERGSIVHVPHILYHRRSNPEPRVEQAQIRTVSEAFERKGVVAEVEYDDRFNIVHAHPLIEGGFPKVSIIIPTRDAIDLLSKCLTSIFELTDYPVFEILIIDNGSSQERSLKYFREIEAKANVRVLRVDAPFNFSYLNNYGAREASGEILALLNNDIEIIEKNWMRRLAAYAVSTGVGAVGARLLYPDRTVQHGGVILGNEGILGHAHAGLSESESGYGMRAVVDQSTSAVTAACLFVSKINFNRVQGLDEDLKVCFNDVDFCLRLQRLGLRNIYAGTVTCIHHESATRGKDDTPEKRRRDQEEGTILRCRWADVLNDDPHYNPNLSVTKPLFSNAVNPRRELPWRSKKIQ